MSDSYSSRGRLLWREEAFLDKSFAEFDAEEVVDVENSDGHLPDRRKSN